MWLSGANLHLVRALAAAREIGEAADGDEGHAVGVGHVGDGRTFHVQHPRAEGLEGPRPEGRIVDEGTARNP